MRIGTGKSAFGLFMHDINEIPKDCPIFTEEESHQYPDLFDLEQMHLHIIEESVLEDAGLRDIVRRGSRETTRNRYGESFYPDHVQWDYHLLLYDTTYQPDLSFLLW